MKRNVFYVFAGIVALLEVGLLWFAIDLNNALLIQAGLVVGIILVYLARRTVSDVIEDERSTLISQKSALRTLEIFWVIFFLISMGSVVIGFNRPFFPPPPLPPTSYPHIGIFGFFQLAFLCLMIFLYVGFKIYFARKYGEFETDEE
ncbi:MAG: DUF2178 domain-containing protein [Methanomicrobiales archaeon]|nr:DUF2178 domain-containing protein [Methanomicrobiales archaeon]